MQCEGLKGNEEKRKDGENKRGKQSVCEFILD
jgi:hypothetical protein